MRHSNESMDPKAQEQFEKHIFSLMEKEQLFVPKAALRPEKELARLLPTSSRSERWTDGFRRLGKIFWQPALAYSLALCLAYPAYRGLVQKPQIITKIETQTVPAPAPPSDAFIGATRDFALASRTRDDRAGERTVALAPGDAFFTLSFFIPIQSDSRRRYDVDIRDARGALIAERQDVASRDGLGNFSLVCPRTLFKDGSYILNVRRMDRTRLTVEREDHFRFNVTHSEK